MVNTVEHLAAKKTDTQELVESKFMFIFIRW